MPLLVTMDVPFIVLISLFSLTSAVEDDSPVVQTSYGPVRGAVRTSTWTKQAIYSFQGIPYASPPIGELRFKDPIPPAKWTSERDCTADANSCMQNIDHVFILLNISFSISEDCLYLNVYTPQLETGGAPMPVMVWIHGGGFIEGSGSYFRYGPDFLVAEGVVVVTMNYRLGALGFATLGTKEVPGNVALKDQRLALQWVQSEISRFGGDASKVTIFGESAGSASVHLHYLSPLSKGLFHQAIGESGAALAEWVVCRDAEVYGLQLASALNCSTADLSAAHRCLMEATAENILEGQNKVNSKGLAKLIFVPSVDKECSDLPFLPARPSELLEQGEGSSVPFLMGINSDEGMLMLMLGDDYMKNITNNLEQFILEDVRKKSSKARLKAYVDRIRRFYFNETTDGNVKGYINLYTDFMFGYATAKSAKAYRERNPTVYLYYFNFDGKFKEIPVKYIIKKYNITGVSHAEELSYLFIRQKVDQSAPNDSREMKTWRRMVKMWTNFAKYGKPTVGAQPDVLDVDWEPVGRVSTRYLVIGDQLSMVKEDFLELSVALWDSISSSSPGVLLPTLGAVTLGAITFLIVK